MNIKDWQILVHEGAKQRGFYDGDLGEKSIARILSMLCLIHSEVSEAVEEVRRGNMITYYEELTHVDSAKPKGLGSELADVMIRLLDTAEWLGIDMEEEMKVKNAYNDTRGHMHGGKLI
jgi:NTP pyrophosphatase (non-canonical NTP hydrolase)